MIDPSSIMFVGAEEVSLDNKGRMILAYPFMRIMRALRKNSVYVSKRRIDFTDASYPILQIKYELMLPEKLTEEERIEEYSAIRMGFDKQNRIIIPERFISHLANNRETPTRVSQTGRGDRVYVWNLEDWREREQKISEKGQ